MKLLADKVVLITGASQGIGKGIAIRCAEHGANIAFTHLSSPDKAKEVENELFAIGVKAKGYQSDASEFESSHKLVEDVMEDFGQIDVLVNNAGITKDGLLMRMSEQDWDDVLRVNLKSIFNMTKAVQRTMLKQRKGSIINLSSVVGVNGNAGQSNYSASKAGMIGFTKSIAKELGSRNIRSNAIAPGFIATKMTAKLDQDVVGNWVKEIPLKRAGTTEDVADV
ncbi:MAG: 3-oxoacyl-[acyl-carrier protein] reductase, partial [Flavobacteriales bacterium]